MTWRFDSVRKYDATVPVCFCDTQFGLAVGNGSSIKILAYWGEETEFEYGIQQGDIYPHLYIAPEYVTNENPGDIPAEDGYDLVPGKTLGHWANMKVVKELTIPTPNTYAKHLLPWQNKLFVFTNNTSMDANADEAYFLKMYVFDLLSGVGLSVRQLAPTPFRCKPIIHKGKIWLTTAIVEDDENDVQYLVSYDATTYEKISETPIPARKQARHHHFVAVGDWLIVDLFNDNSVAKFNAVTGAFVSKIFVNRKPLAMFYNGDNKLIVGSYKGMISEVDLETEDVTHITASSGEATGGIIDDGRYVWVGTEGGLSRTDKTLEEFNLISQSGSGSSSIETGPFIYDNSPRTDIREVLISQPFTYQAWINNQMVEHERKGYILVRNSKQVLAIRNVPMWHDYYNQVLGTSMIATPETEYYGETE